MSSKVSVIVPIYNAEVFLKKCIYSLMKQTYGDLEIILIDNDSKDGSAEICRHFAQKDPRIVLLTQPISGVSAARNMGLEVMTGDFLAFLDADDWFESDAIEKSVTLMEKHAADTVFFNSLSEQNGQRTPRATELATGVVDTAELVRQMLCTLDQNKVAHGYFFSLWNKLFRVSSLRRTTGGIQPFDPKLRILEDGVWLMQHVPQLHTGVLCDECLHHRLIHGQSAMANEERFLDTWQEYLSAYSRILDRVNEMGDPKALELCKGSYFRAIRRMVDLTSDLRASEQPRMVKVLNTLNPAFASEFILDEFYDLRDIRTSLSFLRGQRITAFLENHFLARALLELLHFIRNPRKFLTERRAARMTDASTADEGKIL